MSNDDQKDANNFLKLLDDFCQKKGFIIKPELDITAGGIFPTITVYKLKENKTKIIPN